MSNVPQPRDNKVYTFEGRNFSQFGLHNNIHCLPVDEPEERNFDTVDTLFNELLGRAILPSIPIQDIDDPWLLDCGFGKGAWIETVLNGSEATLVGIDIFTGNGDEGGSSDSEESEGPENWIRKRWNLNASFRLKNDPNLRPDTFNLINSRFLTDGINTSRWDSYIRELRLLLVPGGWLQMVEVSMAFQSDSGRLDPSTSFLYRWWEWYRASLVAMDKNPDVGRELANRMRDAGFERIHSETKQLPIGGWMPGRSKDLGERALRLVSDMIRSATLWPFLRVVRPPMSRTEYAALIGGARQELEQQGLKLYLRVYVAYGRRPRRR